MLWNTICFDLDNTLFSHEEAFEHAIMHTFEETLKELNQKYDDLPSINIKDWFRTFKYNCDYYWENFENNKLSHDAYRKVRYEKTMETFGLPVEPNSAKNFHDQYEEVVVGYSVPYKGLHELLNTLKDAKINLGIITNGKRETQERKVVQLDINKYIPFEHLIVSEDAGAEKPEKEIFDLALKKINGEENKALFIGDSWKLDVQGAIAANWDAIFLNTRNEKRTRGCPPFAEHFSLAETAQFLYRSLHLKG
ncbi:HAD family hydrolase [Alteribacillus sp. YIM 98480]|uniref:HAD family hydrolase n=1 Tax=Alteribacillus sp. YIM 98480 TaxID=2606599 RepID=UPI00131C026F|nr:HAD family hydrolase [Alteribacillus sp. YIM 98480]